ncbi:hypothetical protein ABT354_08135 [Streptomyces sp. NPDC000594]|uniref:hypothetical protein n=1 Tax=Streptomyces sp. NPDC000594 TaxID=3154261 RepID=UPI00332AF9BD
MGSDGRGPRAGQQCPVCGEPVGTVITRRKTLGAFVPSWGPGPCRNADCTAFDLPPARAGVRAPREAAHGSGGRSGPPGKGSGAPPGAGPNVV